MESPYLRWQAPQPAEGVWPIREMPAPRSSAGFTSNFSGDDVLGQNRPAGTNRSTCSPAAGGPGTPCRESVRRRACRFASRCPDRQAPAFRRRPCRTAFAARARLAASPRMLGHGDAVGQRAEVVRAERRPQMSRCRAGRSACSRSKLASRFPLLLKDGNRPAVGALAWIGFVVPVGPFTSRTQTGVPRLAAQSRSSHQVAAGIAQIALDHDADVGPVAKFVLHQHLLEDVQRQVLFCVRLHVDVDERLDAPGGAQQLAQACRPTRAPCPPGRSDRTGCRAPRA